LLNFKIINELYIKVSATLISAFLLPVLMKQPEATSRSMAMFYASEKPEIIRRHIFKRGKPASKRTLEL
jgi:hypothetical protein